MTAPRTVSIVAVVVSAAALVAAGVAHADPTFLDLRVATCAEVTSGLADTSLDAPVTGGSVSSYIEPQIPQRDDNDKNFDIISHAALDFCKSHPNETFDISVRLALASFVGLAHGAH